MNWKKLIKEDFAKSTLSPFEYLQKKYAKFIDLRVLESTFEDFDTNFITIQTKIIYEELKSALNKKEIPFIMRSFHPELINITGKNILDKKLYQKFEYINNKLSKKSKDWRMIDLKIYQNVKEEKPFCLASFKYHSLDFKKTEKIIFYRDMENRKSYFNWKIIDIENLKIDENLQPENKAKIEIEY